MFLTQYERPITYNGREYTKDITKITQDYDGINTLDDLFEKLLDAWCKETAYPTCQTEYDLYDDPTCGQCAITATLVHDIFGGEIYKIYLEGGGTHYFNKINGNYIDLTSDQFTQFNVPLEYEPNEKVPREYCGKNENTMKRFNLLTKKLKENLNQN